jgi:Peptidase M50B-like
MTGTSLGAELARIGQLQARLPGSVAVALGIVALGAATLPDIWRVTQHVNTLVHEGAHATMGSALGQRVGGVTIKRDGTGETAMQGGGRSGSIMVGLIGYLGPSGFGLAAAQLIQLGHIVAVLWLAMALLLCMLVVVRQPFGLVTVLCAGALLFVVAAYTSLGAQIMAGYLIAWFLLLSGIRVIWQHGTRARDATILREITHVPQGFWSILWLLGSLAALGYGATLLV